MINKATGNHPVAEVYQLSESALWVKTHSQASVNANSSIGCKDDHWRQFQSQLNRTAGDQVAYPKRHPHTKSHWDITCEVDVPSPVVNILGAAESNGRAGTVRERELLIAEWSGNPKIIHVHAKPVKRGESQRSVKGVHRAELVFERESGRIPNDEPDPDTPL